MASDLSDNASLEALYAAAVKSWGQVDCLVCNAALLHETYSDRPLAPDAFASSVTENLYANFRLANLVAPGMIERRSGSIIFISSVSAHVAIPARLVYGASKAALENMARNLAAGLAPFNVRVNCIVPGAIRSRGTRAIASDPQLEAGYVRSIPLGRMGEPREIGSAVVFLASEASAYITGATIPVAGGRTTIGTVVGTNDLAEEMQAEARKLAAQNQ
jgi:NAD(P)-dependent dehydrogenase (short-subunit alcohol dehydrogenase family)